MGEKEVKRGRMEVPKSKRNGNHKAFDPSLFVQLPIKLQNHFKSQLKQLAKNCRPTNLARKEKGSSAAVGIDLERQLQVWRANPSWDDQPLEIKVSAPKGSLCNLNAKVNIGLPPEATYNIVTDPDNRRVFKNIKEVISRRVLLDEGSRQVVEVEQAALWKFLWWSGTIQVHVLVDQNRQDLTMKFKQVKTGGFMKKFEGCWRVQPVFVDQCMCYPFQPKTWAEYHSCTGGKGRVGSKATLEQLIQPTIVPPPPISWYLRGITARTTEMIVNDLIAEAARIRGDLSAIKSEESEATFQGSYNECRNDQSFLDIKGRWALHRRNAKKHQRRLLTGN